VAMKKAREAAEILERTDPGLSDPKFRALSEKLASYMTKGQSL